MRVRDTKARAGAVAKRGQEWVERQDPGSATGVTISAWRHYRSIEGPLQSALLSLYILVAVLPALLVMEEYLDSRPNALASRLVHHYNLNAPTARLLHDVLAEGRAHELGSALLAIASALFFASASAASCSVSTPAPGRSHCRHAKLTRRSMPVCCSPSTG